MAQSGAGRDGFAPQFGSAFQYSTALALWLMLLKAHMFYWLEYSMFFGVWQVGKILEKVRGSKR
jgi:hypothetical protein